VIAVSRAARPAVFLDKDGTLIEDLPYNVDPRRIRLAPGAAAALPRFHDAGYVIAIVTNQSGIARGYFTPDDLFGVRDHLGAVMAELGVPLAGFYFCPHEPEGGDDGPPGCECRKPLPGLIHQAAVDLDIDLRRSWFIGDTWMDAVAGRQAGCRTILVGEEYRDVDDWPLERRPDHVVFDLLSAARIVTAARPERPVDAPEREQEIVAPGGLATMGGRR
jgi:histidinol-phosphate phosphatase family protein